MRWKNLQIIAAHTKCPAHKCRIVALVLQRHQLADQFALVVCIAFLDVENHRRIGFDRTDTVKARDRSNDNDVVAFEQRARRGMPHPVDRFVYRAFFLDIGIRPRDIGLGLIIVVIADKIFDRVFREKAFKFAIKLCGQYLVWGKDKRRPLHSFDYLGHREGLARAGDPQQHLIALARINLLDQLGNRRRLIARRFIFGVDHEWPPAFGLDRA